MQIVDGKFKEYFELSGKLGGEVAEHVRLLSLVIFMCVCSIL